MPTGYLLAACAVAIALSGWGGYSLGTDVERGRAALAMQDAIIATFDAARRDAEAESERRAATAVRNERIAAAARSARLKGQHDALANARPACVWPDTRRVLINAAVAAANADSEAEAERVLPRLPGTSGVGK